MIKKFRTVALFVTLVIASLCAPFAASAQKTLGGHWEGTITQPAGELKIMVDFTGPPDNVKGTFDLLDAAVFRWPLKIDYVSPKVRFRLPMGLLFEGELQGDTISGTVPSPSGGHIDPFYLKRKPAPALPYKEEEVHFQSGGVTLAGTLRLPLTEGTHPALFLLQGSGDADREAESFYADYFVRHGLATLVYDKRGTGSSGGDYREESFNDFAADALAGIHYLQSRKEIDPKRVGLRGRSHGGIIAPLAASLSKDVAFVINVSGTGVPPYQQVTYQAETQMRRDGFSETEIAEALEYMNLKWQVARAGGEGWDRLEVATRNARNKKWADRVQLADKPEDIVPSWKREMSYDPMPALEKVKQPVLAVFGELDSLTPVAATTANYRKALTQAGNRDYLIKVFPGADHALLVWPKPNDQVHWPVLATGYLEAMTTWIDKHVATIAIFKNASVRKVAGEKTARTPGRRSGSKYRFVVVEDPDRKKDSDPVTPKVLNIVVGEVVISKIDLPKESEAKNFSLDSVERDKAGFKIKVDWGGSLYHYEIQFNFRCKENHFYLYRVKKVSFSTTNPDSGKFWDKKESKVTRIEPNLPIEKFAMTDYL